MDEMTQPEHDRLIVKQLEERSQSSHKQRSVKAELTSLGSRLKDIGSILSADTLAVETLLSYLRDPNLSGMVDCSRLVEEITLYAERERRLGELNRALSKYSEY